MNYTANVKKEIYKEVKKADDYKKKAFLMGAIKACVSGLNADGVLLENKDKDFLEMVSSLIIDIFDVEHEIQEIDVEPKIYNLVMEEADASKMLEDLYIAKNGKFVSLHDHAEHISNMEKAQGYLQGVFCAIGNVYFPGDDENDRGYHFELNFTSKEYAKMVQLKLEESKLSLSLIDRDLTHSLYAKKIETISDILAFLSASSAVLKLSDVSVQREVNNDINRVANIEAANMDKVAIANAKYIIAIETIENKKGLTYLADKKLIDIAKARLEDKTASMSALADKLKITKSSLNRALNKIVEKANKLED